MSEQDIFFQGRYHFVNEMPRLLMNKGNKVNSHARRKLWLHVRNKPCTLISVPFICKSATLIIACRIYIPQKVLERVTSFSHEQLFANSCESVIS